VPEIRGERGTGKIAGEIPIHSTDRISEKIIKGKEEEMKKRLVVVGAVAAGPKAAARAKRCDPDLDVIIYQEEAANSYGGCGLPYYISGLIHKRGELLARTPEQFARDGIQIKLQHRVEEIQRESKTLKGRNLLTGEAFVTPYDKLILATGAKPIRPKIDGINLGNIFTLRSIFDGDAILQSLKTKRIKSVVIAGGGYIGLETAEALHQMGKKVTLIELAPQIATLFDEEFAAILHQYLKKKGIRILTAEGLTAFLGHKDRVCGVQTSLRQIETQAVILSLGIRPNVELAQKAGIRIGETGAIWVNERMETNSEDIFAAGDCTETTHLVTGKKVWIPLGSTANKQGRVVGTNVCGGNATFPGVLGTSIFKAFDYAVAKTGLNMREGQKEGFQPMQAIVRGYGQAHYYPGGKESILKLIADRDTGRILGAEAIGEGPSDKFIDTVAMGLLARMDCRTLAAADLAYSPPFSPALSPVIVAANVLQNKIQGTVDWISAAELKQKLDSAGDHFQLLDVREEKEEGGKKSIPGSVRIPLDSLDQRMGEIDAGKEIAVHCVSGLRSYRACLKLKKAGFENTKNVDGGMLCWSYGMERDGAGKSKARKKKK
jgi:NADPH-dependent 2,4-dienoyl-CoA reductase/sulfur reductase-like enzyme/rhodanese-related sulfurtransferase